MAWRAVVCVLVVRPHAIEQEHHTSTEQPQPHAVANHYTVRRGWYYTAARNVTRAWSLHHGGPAAPVATNAYGNGDVSCSTFVGASEKPSSVRSPLARARPRRDEIETALGFIEGRRGTSSDKSSSSTSDAKVATAAAVAVVVTIVLLVAFVASMWFYSPAVAVARHLRARRRVAREYVGGPGHRGAVRRREEADAVAAARLAAS